MEMNNRPWDFCDQCFFYVACLRKEKKQGDGCSVFEPYPYERKENGNKPVRS
jgi:hypothetical protein